MPQERGLPTVLCPDWDHTEVVTARQLLKVLRVPRPRAAVPELGSGPPCPVTILCTFLWFC